MRELESEKKSRVREIVGGGKRESKRKERERVRVKEGDREKSKERHSSDRQERCNVRTVWQIDHDPSGQSTQHSLIQVKWPVGGKVTFLKLGLE